MRRILYLTLYFVLAQCGIKAANAATVLNTNDSGGGSLRQAIRDAIPGETITFSVNGTINLTSGELLIDKDLTIIGPGAASLTIQRSTVAQTPPAFGIFHVEPGTTSVLASVHISGLTITRGDAQGENGGGGIFNGASLTLSNCVITGNTTSQFGGGVSNAGTLTVSNCILSNNNAPQGGGIANTSGTVMLSSTTISGNMVAGFGGGLHTHVGGMVTVFNSTISGNTAGDDGAGLYVNNSTLKLTNCTVTNNAASSEGGGLDNFGTVEFRNTILAGNRATVSNPDCRSEAGRPFTSLGHNLLASGSQCAASPTDVIVDPATDFFTSVLGPLQNNGGPTPTHALPAGSPAIDAGDNSVLGPPSNLATDQRGQPRRVGPAVDIGAYEFAPMTGPFAVTNTADDDAGSLRRAILSANANPGPDTIVFNIPPEPRAPRAISPVSALPEITSPVTIDGTTQPGVTGKPLIELNGSQAGPGVSGLTISAGNSTVRGLVINRFNAHGILIRGRGGNHITGNFIGTDAGGTGALGNGANGILIDGTPGNVIGGTMASQHNVISGNNGNGVTLLGAGATRNVVQGNFIGTAADGTSALGNRLTGVLIVNGAHTNVIGTLLPGGSNIIAANRGDGIAVTGAGTAGNAIRANAVFGNGGLGIDLERDGVTPNDSGDVDTGGNNQQNFPVLTSAVVSGVTATITGTLNSTPNTRFVLDFYANSVTPAEGQFFLGSKLVDTNGSGVVPSFSFSGAARAGQVITATATAGGGSTSEFSTGKQAVPAISISDASVSEGDAGTQQAVFAVFTVSLSAASSQRVSVNYATADGTAQQPGDYVSAAASLTFAPGETRKEVAVAINGDTLDEVNETFFMNLSNATNAIIADKQGIGTILDDDATPTLAIDDVVVNPEGNAGTTKTATFTVTLSAASGLPVTVRYSTADGTARAGSDYVGIAAATPGTLTIPANTRSGTISVTINGDNLDEVNEAFVVNLSSPTNATIAKGQGSGTILDDDAPPRLSINDVTVTEGSTAAPAAVFQVKLTAASSQSVTVNFSTANGTAAAGSDYSARSGTLRFPPGITEQSINVPILNDDLDEASETIFVNLTIPINATIADSQGIGTITDNDGAPVLSINDVALNEGDNGITEAKFTVTLSTLSGQAVTVRYETVDITAHQPGDYEKTSGILSFAPGQKTATITVEIRAETLFEPNETFLVNLSGAVNATLADGRGIGTIINDDGSAVVTTTADTVANDGLTSLREALDFANAHPGATIRFNIPVATAVGGVFTIKPLTPLPAMAAAGTILDGTTQTTARGNTNPLGPEIVLDGSAAGPTADGLIIRASNCVVRHLVIHSFAGSGVSIVGAATGNQIAGNYIGTNATGTAARANGTLVAPSAGVRIVAGASANVIGGTTAGARNVISGNRLDGILIAGANTTGNVVQGNFIGTDAIGTGALPNLRHGVGIDGSPANTIGAAVRATGAVAVSTGNVIAFNRSMGVNVASGATSNCVRGNRLFSNGALGLNLASLSDPPTGVTLNDMGDGDSGPNTLQNFPVITDVTTSGSATILGGILRSTPGTSFLIDFYRNSSADPSGFGEGEFHLGSTTTTTNPAGTATFSFSALGNPGVQAVFTATATRTATGDTSEFSRTPLQIFSFTPASGPVGTTVTIIGAGFSGVSSVRFNGVSAAFTVNSPSRITATAPRGATSGPISVVASDDSATSAAPFTVLAGPLNNDFVRAQVLTGSSGRVTGTNVDATKEPGEPAHAGKTGGKSVWYVWTAPGSGYANFTTTGSGFDTLLAVYTGTRVDALREVTGNDDGDTGFTSSVTFGAVQGRTYFIAVDGLAGAAGAIVLNWRLSSVSGTVVRWINPAGGAWGTAANWSPARVPGPGDLATIDLAGTYTVNLNVDATVSGLLLGAASGTQILATNGRRIVLTGGSRVSGHGVINLNGGLLAGNGDLEIAGTVNWTRGALGGSGSTIITATGNLNIGDPAGIPPTTKFLTQSQIYNVGTVTWSGAGSILTTNNVKFKNGGTFIAASDSTFRWDGVGAKPAFINLATGRFIKSAGAGVAMTAAAPATTFDRVILDNSGTVEVRRGILRLQGGGKSYGTFDIPAGAQLQFTGDYLFDKERSRITGTGHICVLGGTIALDNVVNAQRFEICDGILTGSSSLNVSDEFNWEGGTLSGEGQLNIARGAEVTIFGPEDKNLTGFIFNNAGSAEWTGSGQIIGSNGATINNSGTLNTQSGQTMTLAYGSGGVPNFNNSGTLNPGDVVPETARTRSATGRVMSRAVGQAAGIVNMFCNYSQAASGILNIDLAGNRAGTSYDQVNIHGRAALDGTLNIRIESGFVPQPGAQYAILTYTARSNTFSTINGLNLSNGTRLEPTYTPTGLVLTVVSGTHSIRGRVIDSAGAGVTGVTITRSGTGSANSPASVTTDSTGNYHLPNVPPGTYTITPSLNGTTFDPGTRRVVVGGNDVPAIDFTALFSISGRVVNSAGAGLGNVAISRGTGAPSVLTDANGNYRFTRVPQGSHVLTPAHTNFNFDPASRNVIISPNSGSAGGINFVGLRGSFISGRVTDSAGNGLAGATVKRTDASGNEVTVLTDAPGYYSFEAIPPGTYLVGPILSGWLFNFTDVTISSMTHAPNLNFAGTRDNFSAAASAQRQQATSAITLSTATARAAHQSVQLTFSGALDATLCTDTARYTVAVNGSAVAVQSVAYQTGAHTVVLRLAPGTLRRGDSVAVAWRSLRDTKGAWLDGRAGPLIVRD